MAWLINGRTFARKVKDPKYPAENYMQCPSCRHEIDKREVMPEWPGLPAGVKFDPTDKEILEHLAAQVGLGGSEPHPFIDEFIPTLAEDDGICYTHPEKFPGIRRDGTSTHFFHRPTRAYTTGTRKRRKVHSCNDEDEIRWHKTGKTRPVLENNKQLGCKKIMVLYASFGKKTKPEKTNWVMHQYHLGLDEEEREGELVVSKVFYQIQPRQGVVTGKDNVEELEQVAFEQAEEKSNDSSGVTSASVTPVPSHSKGLMVILSEQVIELNGTLAQQQQGPAPFPGLTNEQLVLMETEQMRVVCEDRQVDTAECRPSDTPQCEILREEHWFGSEPLIATLARQQETAPFPEPMKERLVLPETNVETKQVRVMGEDRQVDTTKCCVSDTPQCDLMREEHLPSFGSQPFSGSLDADLLKLLCNENLNALSQGDGTNDWKSIVAEACSKLESQDALPLDKIALGTPPADFLEHLFNSQGSLADWTEKLKVWSDSQKTEECSLSDLLQSSQPLP